MIMKKYEKYRKPHPNGFYHKEGDDFGWFEIPRLKKVLRVQLSEASQLSAWWRHVSVSTSNGTPTWNDMCFVKDLFFDEEDVVVQFHPKKSEYVNIAKNCLHLWKWEGGEFPTPPTILV